MRMITQKLRKEIYRLSLTFISGHLVELLATNKLLSYSHKINSSSILLDLSHWRVRWGYHYDNLKLVSATSFKDCVDACYGNPACFVLTWLTVDGKCFIQGDGNGRVYQGSVRRVANAVSLFARRNRLLQFRKNFGLGLGIGLAPGPLVSLGGFYKYHIFICILSYITFFDLKGTSSILKFKGQNT